MTTISVNGCTYQLPFAELFPPLRPDKEAELRASIAVIGLRSPVLIYDSPTWGECCVIDGVNRLRIAARLNIPVPVEKWLVSDETARRLAEDLNIARRQVSPADAHRARTARIERVVAARSEGKSLRAIAREEEVSMVQVQRDLQDATVPGGTVSVPGGTVDVPARITGLNGKEQSTSQPTSPTSEPKGEPTGDPEPQTESGASVTHATPRLPLAPDANHPYAELLQDIAHLAGKIGSAISAAAAKSRLRSYLLHAGFACPRNPAADSSEWECIGLRGIYHAIDLAGRDGRKLSKAQLRQQCAAAVSQDDGE